MNLTTVPASQVVAPSAAGGLGSPVDLENVVVVGVDGDVDIYTAPRLLQTLQEVLAAPAGGAGGAKAAGLEPGAQVEVAALVVDLTKVEFIDSSAIGVLVQGHHLTRRSGRGYALVAIHPMVHALFEITGLARVLPLYPDVVAAAGSLRPGEGRSWC